MSNYIFHACTKEGHLIRVLAEILQACLRDARLIVTHDGIHLLAIDNNKQVLVKFFLKAENFEDYILNLDNDQEQLEIGIKPNRFFSQLKSTKKNDHVSLFILDDSPEWLNISIKKPDAEREATVNLKIQEIQVVMVPDMPEYDVPPILILANEFQRMIRDVKNVSKTVQITSKGQYIRFFAGDGEICRRECIFGEYKDIYEDCDDYQEVFEISQFMKLVKCTGITTKVKIFTVSGKPLKVKMTIGTLGDLEICIHPITEDEQKKLLK